MYKVVDLFAGAGGLSLGFMQTKKYDIKVAFENNPAMQKTYKKNHMGVDVQDDVCLADYNDIQKKYGKIDVVIGGPPCQGFSNANRQKNHAISQNNMLVKQYIRAIRELSPKAFVMENVSMLRSDVHRFYLDEADNELFGQEKYEIHMQSTKLVLLDKAYMFDCAKTIARSSSAITANIWPEDCYVSLNVVYKMSKNHQKGKIQWQAQFMTQQELINFRNSMSTTFMNWYYYNIVVPAYNKLHMSMFVMQDYTQPWDDKRFCAYFGITGYIDDDHAVPNSEWEIILNTMKQ